MKELIQVMDVQTTSYQTKRMERFIKKKIDSFGLEYEVDAYGNIYVTKGDADLYPTMVCHIDTVHDMNDNFEVHRSGNNLFAIDKVTLERLGIGGDDKVGVYITLEMLKHFDNFKAVFFKDEEVGCVGSSKADFTFFDDSTIVLECDRQGISDFVNSISCVTLYSKEFSHDISTILNAYGRKEVYGGMTDVLEVAYNTNVCVANMSCGYYDPHSDNEYIKISEVMATKDMCIEILEATSHKRYEVERRDTYARNHMYLDSSYYNDICKTCGCEMIYDVFDDVEYCEFCEPKTIDYVEYN